MKGYKKYKAGYKSVKTSRENCVWYWRKGSYSCTINNRPAAAADASALHAY